MKNERFIYIINQGFITFFPDKIKLLKYTKITKKKLKKVIIL